MLTPAYSAIAFVMNAANPSVSRMRAAASRMASTIAADRAWRGCLRTSIRVDVLGMERE